jgi:hypothetical protein
MYMNPGKKFYGVFERIGAKICSWFEKHPESAGRRSEMNYYRAPFTVVVKGRSC